MLAHIASRSGGSQQQVLRLLLVSSHSQQQTAAVAREYATDNAGDKDRQQDSSQLQQYAHSDALQQDQGLDTVFDARAASQPLRVHQLIGDPRTGVADDTTTAPFSNDIQVQHLFQCADEEGTNWFRYSMAGPHLPYMYMDSRLSDHSKNMMYMLRCKDPQRWTIPALADKFRIRRQRVMAILALKEIQAHKIQSGASMPGPLQHYVYNVPLDDFQLDSQGQPKDLLQLLQQQEALQQQQQQQGPAAAAAQTLESAEGLGSLEEFLAPEGQQQQAAAEAVGSNAASSSSSSIRRVDQQADLAVLMPQVAFTAQQLQVQLLQLLQSHHYSMPELQRRLLQQIDVAEAYHKAHIQGTPLERLLLGGSDTQQPPAAAAAEAAQDAAAEGGDGDSPAAADGASSKPAFLDFDLQRQAVQQLVGLLEPLLASAGPHKERETGCLLVKLQQGLAQHQGSPAPPAAAAAAEGSESASEAAGDQQQAQQQQGLEVIVAAADPAILVSAFNELSVEQRQQLLDAVPDARITLNIQGTDLRAALSSSSSSSSRTADSASPDSSSSSSSVGEWPGQVPTLVDVWQYAEVPRQQLSAVLEVLPVLQGVLEGVDSLAALTGTSSSSSSRMQAEDVNAVQQAVNVYSGLLVHYDRALTDQAKEVTQNQAAAILPPSSQRRLVRILRELDPNAVRKLLLWESVMKEGAEGEAVRLGDTRKFNRLKMRVQAEIKALDKEAAASGYSPASAEYPDLPSHVPADDRHDKDMKAAELEANVVGRQFHRGSGDRMYVSVPTYPRLEGLSLQEFDASRESEISIINRLAADRQDNVMWREFRMRLMRNMGLLAPDLAQHSGLVKPPKPAAGWSWVVHPMGGAAKAVNRERMRVESAVQWEDETQYQGAMTWYQENDLQSQQPVQDPARGPAPKYPYVAEPGGRFRALNEEEAVVLGDTKPKPRPRWFANRRAAR